MIDGVLGAVAGATLTEISTRATREAYMSGRPVEYRTEDERGVYRVDPVEYNASTRCSKINKNEYGKMGS